jgi:lipoprotein-releasing system ATP-binding protein
MIILKNLSKTFIKDGNKIEVLRSLNLAIEKGESLAILGVSGAGKSTLIHIMGMLDHPTDGCLSIDGMNVFDKFFSIIIFYKIVILILFVS